MSSPVSPVTVRYQRPPGKVVEESFTDTFTVGRDARCAVRLDGPTVSSMHARVTRLMGHWWVQDLYSKHGLYVHGRKVQQAEVRDRLVVYLGPDGPALELVVAKEELLSAPPPARPAAPPPTATPRQGPPSSPTRDPVAARPTPPEGEHYRAHRFSLTLPDAWKDQTVYVLAGPLTEGLQHNITVNIDPEAPFDALQDYADVHVQALETGLQGVRVLKKDRVELNNGLPAYRVLYTWTPTDNHSVFQEQLFVLHQGTGYRLTATFSRKTRKTLGPDIERVMLSFVPGGSP